MNIDVIDKFGHEFVDGVKEYLNTLRESGVTNMFGAVPYIKEEYPNLTYKEATAMLKHWMETFGE